jgi:catalase-peroxidase
MARGKLVPLFYMCFLQDMGPATRCTGPDVPPPQDFQDPLPEPDGRANSVDWVSVYGALQPALSKNELRGKLAGLAYNCAATYRIGLKIND